MDDQVAVNAGFVEDVGGWITPEIRAALARIGGEHAGKKRESVIRLAFARAMGQTLEDVFALESVCNQRIWYQKWSRLQTVQAAYDLCYAQALAWRDEETARCETQYANDRRRLIAQESITAVRGLALTAVSVDDRADYRIEASLRLLELADPELFPRGEQAAALPVEVTNLGALLGEVREDELGYIEGALRAKAADPEQAAGGGAKE